jgi:hypothetical protein
MFVRVEPTTLMCLVPPPPEKRTSPPWRLACKPQAAQSSRRRPPKCWPAVPPCAVSTKHRGGNAGRALRVLAAHAVRHCAVRSRRTGAAVRGYSAGTQAVRTHRYASEGRADDADVAIAAVSNTHEPTVTTGLHTTRRAELAVAPAQRLAGGTPLCSEYQAPRRYAGRALQLLAAPAVRHCAVRSRRTGAAVRGYSAGTQAVRTHRYASEGRADDADVADATVVDTHEPAVAFGLYTTGRAKLAAAPT